MVADEQPGDDHRDRAAEVQEQRQRIGDHDHGEGDQDLEAVLVDRQHRAVPDIAEDDPEHRAADGFQQEQLDDLADADVALRAADGNGHDDGEHHDPDTVVEQRFAGDLGLERARHRDGLEDSEHGDRVGRADQGAEDQRPDKRNLEAEQLEAVPHRPADQERRQDHAECRHHGDGPFAAQHLGKVDVERPGEQQEAEHALHQGFLEIDLAECRDHRVADGKRRRGIVDADDRQRCRQRDQHQADGCAAV